MLFRSGEPPVPDHTANVTAEASHPGGAAAEIARAHAALAALDDASHVFHGGATPMGVNHDPWVMSPPDDWII